MENTQPKHYTQTKVYKDALRVTLRDMRAKIKKGSDMQIKSLLEVLWSDYKYCNHYHNILSFELLEEYGRRNGEQAADDLEDYLYNLVRTKSL